MQNLKESGIGSQVHYIPVPMHPFYSQFGYNLDDYKNALNYYSEALSIPLFFSLEDNQQEYVIEVINSLLNSKI